MGNHWVLRLSLRIFWLFLGVGIPFVPDASAQQVINIDNAGPDTALQASVLLNFNPNALVATGSTQVVSDQTLSQSNIRSPVNIRLGTASAIGGAARFATGSTVLGSNAVGNALGIVNISMNTGVVSNSMSAASVAFNVSIAPRAP
jgi:hypothetical protein